MTMNALICRLSPWMKRVSDGGRLLFSDKYLLSTNIGISVSLSLTGDILQQKYQIIQKNMKYWNPRRMLHVASSGFVLGIYCHYWYIYLDRWFPGRTFKIIFRKLLLDQLICSPIYIGLYFVTIGMLERQTFKAIASESLVKGSTIYTMEWVIWPPAQIINFYLLPTKYRVLYDSVIGLAFDSYYSNVKYHSSENNFQVSNGKRTDTYLDDEVDVEDDDGVCEDDKDGSAV